MSKIPPFCVWFKGLFSGWMNVVGITLTSAGIFAAFVSVTTRHNLEIPAWLSLLIAVIAFVFVSYRVWRKQWDRAEVTEPKVNKLETDIKTIKREHADQCLDEADFWWRNRAQSESAWWQEGVSKWDWKTMLSLTNLFGDAQIAARTFHAFDAMEGQGQVAFLQRKIQNLARIIEQQQQ